MNEFKQIQQTLTKKIQELNRLRTKAERSLKKAPEGSLVVSSSNGVPQYFHKNSNKEKKGTYIKKANQKLTKALAQKDYDQHFLKEVDNQIKQIEKVLKGLPDREVKELFSCLSEQRKELVTPHILTDEQYIEQWLSVKYTGKNFAGDLPLHMTDRGERVRSKSEKMIADKLYSLGIPYRYEYPLKLNNYWSVYPDFELLQVTTRKEIYYEHFGMMDDPEYSQKAILKMQEYQRHGIYLGKNLLVSFETKSVPLDMNLVEKMLREYVL